MKKLFQKIKGIFLVILLVPVLFISVACGKKDKDSTETPSNPPIEQPGGDSSGGSSGGGSDAPAEPDPEPPVPVETFNVNIEYNLPTYIEDLLEDEIKTANVATGFSIPTFEGTEFAGFVNRWFYKKDNSEITTQTISAEKDATVEIYATWKETDIEKYFATSGLNFEFDEGNGLAIPISYTGSSDVVVIPKIVKRTGGREYIVEKIAEDCFKDNQIVKEVRTYLSDFSVEKSAFENSLLEKIEFNKILSVGEAAFKNTNVTIAEFSNKLSTISKSMFENCENLVTVDFSSVMGATFAIVPEKAFSGCTKLKNCYLSTQMTQIQSYAFAGCSAIDSFDFVTNSSITNLRSYAFQDCISLDNIDIPQRIVSYGTNIFDGCKFTSIKIATLFGDSFSMSNSFSNYYGNMTDTLKKVELYGTKITSIYKNYFKNYSNLEEFVMNDTLSQMGNNAFSGCAKLEKITFSKSVDYVGKNINFAAFADTKWYKDLEKTLEEQSLNSLSINKTLLYISKTVSGDFAIPNDILYVTGNVFSDRNSITSVSIPASVIEIDPIAFNNNKLTSITVDASNQKYTLDDAVLESYDVEGNVTGTIQYSALYKAVSDVKTELIAYVSASSGGIYKIPETVVTIYDEAFSSTNAPSYVYIASSSSNSLIFEDSSSDNTIYIIGNDKTAVSGSSSRIRIYRYIPENNGSGTIYYEVEQEADVPTVNYSVLTRDYGYIKVEIKGYMKYYLIDKTSEKMTDITTIYKNFVG